jgi:hypothetical protein
MNWDIVSYPTQGLQLRLKPIGVIRVELRDTAKKFGCMYSQKGIARPHRPNFHVHVPVSVLYLFPCSDLGPPIFLHQDRQTDQGIYKSLTET